MSDGSSNGDDVRAERIEEQEMSVTDAQIGGPVRREVGSFFVSSKDEGRGVMIQSVGEGGRALTCEQDFADITVRLIERRDGRL